MFLMYLEGCRNTAPIRITNLNQSLIFVGFQGERMRGEAVWTVLKELDNEEVIVEPRSLISKVKVVVDAYFYWHWFKMLERKRAALACATIRISVRFGTVVAVGIWILFVDLTCEKFDITCSCRFINAFTLVPQRDFSFLSDSLTIFWTSVVNHDV